MDGLSLIQRIALVATGAIGAGFGVYALHLGYDGNVIPAVFLLLGTIVGYIVGKNQA